MGWLVLSLFIFNKYVFNGCHTVYSTEYILSHTPSPNTHIKSSAGAQLHKTHTKKPPPVLCLQFTTYILKSWVDTQAFPPVCLSSCLSLLLSGLSSCLPVLLSGCPVVMPPFLVSVFWPFFLFVLLAICLSFCFYICARSVLNVFVLSNEVRNFCSCTHDSSRDLRQRQYCSSKKCICFFLSLSLMQFFSSIGWFSQHSKVLKFYSVLGLGLSSSVVKLKYINFWNSLKFKIFLFWNSGVGWIDYWKKKLTHTVLCQIGIWP